MKTIYTLLLVVLVLLLCIVMSTKCFTHKCFHLPDADDLMLKEGKNTQPIWQYNASVHISRAFAYNWMVSTKLSNKIWSLFSSVDDTCHRFHSNFRLVASDLPHFFISFTKCSRRYFRNTSMSCGGLYRLLMPLRQNGILLGIHGDELHEFTCERFDQKVCNTHRCLLAESANIVDFFFL